MRGLSPFQEHRKPCAQPGFPPQDGRVPVQPQKQERVFSFTNSCLFSGKQARCQKLYPVREGKRGEETEGGGGRRKKIVSLEEEKDGVKMLTIENNFKKVRYFFKAFKPSQGS